MADSSHPDQGEEHGQYKVQVVIPRSVMGTETPQTQRLPLRPLSNGTNQQVNNAAATTSGGLASKGHDDDPAQGNQNYGIASQEPPELKSKKRKKKSGRSGAQRGLVSRDHKPKDSLSLTIPACSVWLRRLLRRCPHDS
jgi:hypothetical protein